MTATASRIGFVTRQYRTGVASDSAVKTKYGEAARDTAEDIIETFFDEDSDAQIIANQRLALLSPDRRRFRQEVNEVLSLGGVLDFSKTTPTVRVIDAERAADHPAAIIEVNLDLGTGRTSLVTWGGLPFTYSDYLAAYDFANGIYRQNSVLFRDITSLGGYAFGARAAKYETGGPAGLLAVPADMPGIVPGLGYWSRASLTNLVASSNNIGVAGNYADPAGGKAAKLYTGNSPTTALTVSTATSYTLSRIVKRGSNDWYRIVVFETANSNNKAEFWANLGTGTAGSSGTLGTGFTASNYAVTSLGDGWYRVGFTFQSSTATALTIGDRQVVANSSTTLADASATIYFYHLQVVAGTQAGPVIQTSGGAGTVGADIMEVATPIASDQDFIAIVVANFQNAATGIERLYALSDGTSNQRIYAQRSADGTLDFGVIATTSQPVSGTSSGVIGTARVAHLVRRAGGKFTSGHRLASGATAMAALAGASASAFPTGLSKLAIGHNNPTTCNANSPIERILFKTGTFDDAQCLAEMAKWV